MDRRFFVAWIVVFVAWMAGSVLVHGVLLRADYMKLPALFRPEAEASGLFGLMILAHLILAGAFTWIYLRGREARPWVAQGVRYGIAVALLTVVPTYIIYYVVQPMPAGMAARQIVFDGALIVLLGVLVAWLYRNAAGRAPAPS
jgi:hypothetical protein